MDPVHGPAQRGDEVFDVVNDRDEVIGQATRAEVHAKGLLHRAIHVWVFDRLGRIFLQKRSKWKDMAPQRWDSSCSGHVDSGETYEAAAVREVREEIGLVLPGPASLALIVRAHAQEETGFEFMQVYEAFSEGPFQLHPAEIEEGRWWEESEVDAAIVHQPDLFTRPFRFLWGQGRASRLGRKKGRT